MSEMPSETFVENCELSDRGGATPAEGLATTMDGATRLQLLSSVLGHEGSLEALPARGGADESDDNMLCETGADVARRPRRDDAGESRRQDMDAANTLHK